MYVARKLHDGKWKVGYYIPPASPDGGWSWKQDSKWDNQDQAWEHIHYLNGGQVLM